MSLVSVINPQNKICWFTEIPRKTSVFYIKGEFFEIELLLPENYKIILNELYSKYKTSIEFCEDSRKYLFNERHFIIKYEAIHIIIDKKNEIVIGPTIKEMKKGIDSNGQVIIKIIMLIIMEKKKNNYNNIYL